MGTERPAQMQETARFLSVLFAPYREFSAARVEVRCFAPAHSQQKIRPPRGWFAMDPQSLDFAAENAYRWRDSYDCYMGVLPRVENGGTAAHLRLCGWLWADIDGGEEHAHEADNLAARAIKDGGVPAPHIAVRSGGGLHLYWRLAELVPMRTREDQEALRKVLLRLVRCIGGENPKAHACPASTDAARILRLPGTFNHKQEGNPRPVRVLHVNEDAPSYPLVWWRAHLPADPLPVARPRFATNNAYRTEPGTLGRATLEKVTAPAPDGRKHYTMLEVAVAARKRGLEEEAVRNLAEQVAAVSGVDTNDPQQVRHLEGLVDWTMRTVMPDT